MMVLLTNVTYIYAHTHTYVHTEKFEELEWQNEPLVMASCN